MAVNYFMPPMPGMAPMNYTVKASPDRFGVQCDHGPDHEGPWNIVIKANVAGKAAPDDRSHRCEMKKVPGSKVRRFRVEKPETTGNRRSRRNLQTSILRGNRMKKTLSAALVLSAMVTFVILSIHVDVGEVMRATMSASPPAYAAGDTTVSPETSQHDHGKNEAVVTVEVPLERQQTMGIRTVAAAVRPLRKTVRTVGRVEFDETKLTTVNIKVDGWVEKLYADYTGKYVEKGAPLAEIYSPELMSVQLEYLNLLRWKPNLGVRSQRNMEFSLGDRTGIVGRLTLFDIDPLVDVIKQKLSLWEIPEKQVKEIETKNQPFKTLTVKSPVSGYVFQKPVFNGTRVAPGDKLFDIVDLSSVWVLADIYEYEIPFVKPGQNAKITLELLSRQTILGQGRFRLPFPVGPDPDGQGAVRDPQPRSAPEAPDVCGCGDGARSRRETRHA